ncbi:hypothetical protein N9A89_01850 [Akkermansiaceae bacterium]|nr:hypothetical protein [Akkermansiaceae bacterium]
MNSQIAFMGSLGTQEMILILMIGVFIALVVVLPFWFICKKAGFSPWLSLITLIPFGAIVLPFILAFVPWKVPTSAEGQ